jgi:hypothetical protein
MKFFRILLTLGFASMLYVGAAHAGDAAKSENGKSCCGGDCCKDKAPTAKKEDKKP